MQWSECRIGTYKNGEKSYKLMHRKNVCKVETDAQLQNREVIFTSFGELRASIAIIK
jgi:hypothetical protein